MPTRSAEAVWEGTLPHGKGTMSAAKGVCEGSYSFSSRFEEGPGTNPEELIGAALAGCYSMQFSLLLERAGYVLDKVHTVSSVHLNRVGGDFQITRIDLSVSAAVPGIDERTLWDQAARAKETCPVSQALKGVEITLALRHIHQFETEGVGGR